MPNITFDKVNLFNLSSVKIIIPTNRRYEVLIKDLEQKTLGLFISFTEHLIKAKSGQKLSTKDIKTEFILFFQERTGSCFHLYNLYLAYLSYIYTVYCKSRTRNVDVTMYVIMPDSAYRPSYNTSCGIYTNLDLRNFGDVFNTFLMIINQKLITSSNRNWFTMKYIYHTLDIIELELIK